MSANEILQVVLAGAYLALLAISVADYRRHRSPVRLALVSVFASVALVYVAGPIGRSWPAARPVTS
ncbi:MAG: hypothetical protein ACRDIL_10150, partial [Candidatus Limnocylindrales bacterium]